VSVWRLSASGLARAARRGAVALGSLVLLSSPLPALAQDTHLVVITGVGGSDPHVKRFHEWATAIVDASIRQELSEANITYLGDKPELDAQRIRARSTRDGVTQALTDLAGRAGQDDEVFIVLIGHGSFDGKQAAFNLSGPDLSAADYATLLGRFKGQVVFVNTASSSGAFLPVLAGPQRTIVTATKTGGERNETRFPEHFVQGLSDPAADADRNGRISIFEAFEFARLRVVTSYEQSGHIATEHPTLDDGTGGKMAAMLYLAPRRSRTKEMAGADPALRALIEEQEKLEAQVAALRLRKDSMDPAAYEAALEKALTELALKSRAVREAEAAK
jgi:hypothetical protein